VIGRDGFLRSCPRDSFSCQDSSCCPSSSLSPPPPPPPPPVLCLSFERILLECFSRFLWCFSGIIGDIFLKIIDDPVGFPSGFSQVERKRTRCSCRDSIRILSVCLSFCLYLVGSFLSDSDCCPNDWIAQREH